MRNVYDAIVSLGGNCAAASQLRIRGLRPYALPFDWTYMDGPETITWLARGFRNGFSDFCLQKNLIPIVREDFSGIAPFRYKDCVSGYNFIHHFWKDAKTEEGYKSAYNVLRRRVDRLLEVVKRSRSLLFVLGTDFEYDPLLASDFLETLRKDYSDKIIDMHVIQCQVIFINPLAIAEKWPSDMPFAGGRYAESMSSYDYSKTDSKWGFLDSLMLANGNVSKKIGRFDGIKYRIWKHLSKSLRDNGCACLGCRF